MSVDQIFRGDTIKKSGRGCCLWGVDASYFDSADKYSKEYIIDNFIYITIKNETRSVFLLEELTVNEFREKYKLGIQRALLVEKY